MQVLKLDYLVDSLVLLLHDNRPDYQNLVRKVIAIYENEKPGVVTITDKDNDVGKLYIYLIKEVIDLSITVADKNAIDTFILKFKSNNLLTKDPELFTTLKGIFTDTEPLEEERKNRIIQRLSNEILINNSNDLMKRAFGRLANVADDLDKQRAVLRDVTDICAEVVKMNEDSSSLVSSEDENTVRLVNFTDKETLAKAFKVHHQATVENRFKTGLQAMNRALQGGITQGNSVVFASLPFGGKSLILMKMARWAVSLNTIKGNFKNPTCIFYSLENEVHQNLQQLFREMYINEFKTLPPENMKMEDIVNYCVDAFGRYGWKLIIERKIGYEFGFQEFVNSYDNYVKLGYKPLVCVIDYVNLMAKGRPGSDSSETGTNNLQIQQLYNNLCNFARFNNCTLITAHQLNRKAAEVARLNPIGAVKRFGEDMMADSMSVRREVDILFYMQKETDAVGNAYMTFKLDKSRYINDIPEKDKYFAYPFFGQLGILDDINTEDMSTDNIFGYEFDKHLAEAIGEEPVTTEKLLEGKDKKDKPEEDQLNLFA